MRLVKHCWEMDSLEGCKLLGLYVRLRGCETDPPTCPKTIGVAAARETRVALVCMLCTVLSSDAKERGKSGKNRV